MYKKLGLLLIVFIFLIACSNKGNNEIGHNSEHNQISNNNDVSNIDDNNNHNELVNAENDTNDVERDTFTVGDDIVIEADVHMSEENNRITVEGTSNLLTNSNVLIYIKTTPYQLAVPVVRQMVSVEEDGTFTFEHDLKENFFVDNNERSLIVEITLDVKDNKDDSLDNIYGANGKNLQGPLIYQREDSEIRQVAEQDVYFIVEGGENSYSSVTNELEDLPDDYGEADVWMEAEIIGNDHHFLYVEGKSNLLEGLELTGYYFPDDESVTPYLRIPSKGKVKPDGSFRIEVPYDDISAEGFVEITSIGPHGELSNRYKEVYGDKYELLTGDIVIDGKLQDTQEIALTIGKKEKNNLAIENALVTESDGELRIRLPDHILFDVNESNLKSAAKATLDEVIDLLEEMDINEDIQIQGHTDNQGTLEINQPLSEDRAAAVATYLKENGDLSSYNLNTVGFADTKPVATNDDEEGRQQNRRVEIIFQEK